MRSQTLAVSLVLLLIAVATLPGISFSLSSSITSYNNSMIYEGPDEPGKTYNGVTINSSDTIHTAKKATIDGMDACEISVGNTGFVPNGSLGSSTSLTITSGKEYAVYLVFPDTKNNSTSFKITITENGQTQTIDNIKNPKVKEGYVDNNGNVVTTPYYFKSNGGVITIDCSESQSAPARVYIVFKPIQQTT